MRVRWRPQIIATYGPTKVVLQYNDLELPLVERVEHYAHVNAVAGYLRGFVAGARSAIAAFDVARSPTTPRGDRQA